MSKIANADSTDSRSSSRANSDAHEVVKEQTCFASSSEFILILGQILNSVLGCGLLSVANSFINTGFVSSFVILIIISIFSYFSSAIIIDLQIKIYKNKNINDQEDDTKTVKDHEQSSEDSKEGKFEQSEDNKKSKESFDDIADQILGKVGSIILTILSILFLTCALLSYIIVAGDVLTSWFSMAGIDMKPLGMRFILIIVYSLVLPVAMTIPRKIEFLKYVSFISMIALTFFIIVMIYKCISGCTKMGGINPTCSTNRFSIDMFSTLSTYAVTFSIPVILVEKTENFSRIKTQGKPLVFTANILCIIIVSIAGLCGYLIFGKDSNPDILNNFDHDDIIIIIVRAAFFIMVTGAYPNVAQSYFTCFSRLVFKDSPKQEELPNGKRAIIIIICNAIPILIGVFLSNLRPVICVAGSLGGCIVNYFFPAILYLQYSDESLCSIKKIFCIILAIFGFVSGCIATYVAIKDAISAF